MAGEVRAQHIATLKAELGDLDKRLGNARQVVTDAQREVDLLPGQHSELHALIRELEGPRELAS